MTQPPSCPRLLTPLRVALVFGVALAAGCPGPDDFVPVEGKVLVEGRPLRGGNVSFRPDAARGNASRHVPTGTLDADGRFVLFTAGKKGAPPGWYKVVVFADNFSADAPPPLAATVEPAKSLVHARYLDEKTTPLAVEVVREPAEGAYTMKLAK